MPEFLRKFLESLFPDPNYRVTASVLFIAIIVILLSLLPRKFRYQRPNLVLGITIVALLVMVLAVGVPNRWQWIVGLLPMLMVGYQLFYVWSHHPQPATATIAVAIDLELRERERALATQQETPEEVQVQSSTRAANTIRKLFGLRTLFVRYGLPAVLLGITGITLADVLVKPDESFSVVIRFMNDPDMAANVSRLLRGIRLGAIGAYVYVLLELGRRTYRHDITGAVAMWCWVTLVLGPVLSATVAFLWRVEPDDKSGWYGVGLVLFFTGFAPRRVIAAIEQAAAQLLRIGTPAVVETRLIPLSKIRGISPQIEERLGEEGITDVNSLATVEPVRLMRDTSFDMKQILTWIDEAILIVTLPRSWEALEDEGITGAIDLAWYYNELPDDEATGDQPAAPAGEGEANSAADSGIPAHILSLATRAKLAPESLKATIVRLYEDTQVQYIWALYNNFTEFSAPDPGEFERREAGG